MNRNLLEMQSLADQETMLGLIDKWTKASDNPELLLMRQCLIRNAVYINSMGMERDTFDRIIDEKVSDAHRAILRARTADESIKALEEQIKSLKSSLNAFGL